MVQENGSSNVAIVAMIVLVLIVIAGVIYFWGFKGKDKTLEDSTSVNKNQTEFNIENPAKKYSPGRNDTQNGSLRPRS